MKPYSEISRDIQKQLEEIRKSDKFGLNSETLYKNIFNSTGSYYKLTEIFEVPIQLVKDIKSQC